MGAPRITDMSLTHNNFSNFRAVFGAMMRDLPADRADEDGLVMNTLRSRHCRVMFLWGAGCGSRTCTVRYGLP
jgi:hypothetical protein